MADDTRRHRLDSATGTATALERAVGDSLIEWPALVPMPPRGKLRTRTLSFFFDCQRARPPGQWRPDEVPPLALYAMALAQVVEHESRFALFKNAEDHKLTMSFQKQALQLGRKLGLTAAAGALATFRRQANDHADKLRTLTAIEEDDGDGLLARPMEGPRH